MILSKQFLYSARKPLTYRAYYIYNGTATLLGDVTDLNKTFAAQDEFIHSNVFVYEGNLYNNGTFATTGRSVTSLTGRTQSSSYYGYFVEDGKLYRFDSSLNISQVGTATDWIKVCGYGSSSSSGYYRAFGEASDGLWAIRTSASSVSNLTGWTKITGYGSTNSSNYYGYGIHNGALYYLYANGNGAVQQGTDTTWTDITGSREGSSWYGYGINNGKLYQLSGTPTQVGSDTTWTKVSGTASSTTNALGLNAGKLYLLSGTTATQVGSSADWENCSGFCMTGDESALAYDSGALYGIAGDGTTTKLMDGNFVYCGQNYNGTNAYAIAIEVV